MEDKKNEKCCTVSSKHTLDEQYWNDQYIANTTNWDLGEVSPPIKEYVNQLTNKNLRILIPGCGNTHEADYLLDNGFTNITVIDIAPALVNQLKNKHALNPNIKIILGDFFEHQGAYDLILEQTFFCAINPSLRESYVKKVKSLLAPNGKLAGVLFNREFEHQGPPFGGVEASYRKLFENDFELTEFSSCYNSHHKRAESELFVLLTKK